MSNILYLAEEILQYYLSFSDLSHWNENPTVMPQDLLVCDKSYLCGDHGVLVPTLKTELISVE